MGKKQQKVLDAFIMSMREWRKRARLGASVESGVESGVSSLSSEEGGCVARRFRVRQCIRSHLRYLRQRECQERFTNWACGTYINASLSAIFVKTIIPGKYTG